MKVSKSLLAYLLLYPFLCLACTENDEFPIEQEHEEDVITHTEMSKIDIADPYIMLYDEKYYAYGTGDTNKGFPVFSSEDLFTWEYEGYALIKENTDNQFLFWAPEVYFLDGRFIMFYASNRQLFVAEAASPTGPFRQISGTPLVSGYGIDPSLFIDDDGRRYLTYTVNMTIYVAELNEDLKSIKTNTAHPVFNKRQDWEKITRGDNEGSTILKHNGFYYMTYSGNYYQSPYYGIGVGISKQIAGYWSKVDYNPILQFPKDLVGTGHHSFFIDKGGKLRIAFHAHHDKKNVFPRQMYIADVHFEEQLNAPDKIVINTDNIITPFYYK